MKKPIYLALVIFIFAIFGILSKTTSSNQVNRIDDKYFSIQIPKLDIAAPIITDIDPTNPESYNEKLTKGVGHMKGSALPGEAGNMFIYGHSSADQKSYYQNVFAKLNDLEKDDKITVEHQDSIYTYKVLEKNIVEKDDFSVLDQSGQERLTLMTCWPIGSDEQRLIVVARRDK